MPRVAPTINLDPQARAELERLARAPTTPQAVAQRARLVLAAGQGLSNQKIATRLHLTANTVGKWRTRFDRFGLSGLTDYQRGGRPRKYGKQVREKLHRLLRQTPPYDRERWRVSDLALELQMPRSSLYDLLLASGFKNRRRPARHPPRD
jgi:transposase